MGPSPPNPSCKQEQGSLASASAVVDEDELESGQSPLALGTTSPEPRFGPGPARSPPAPGRTPPSTTDAQRARVVAPSTEPSPNQSPVSGIAADSLATNGSARSSLARRTPPQPPINGGDDEMNPERPGDLCFEDSQSGRQERKPPRKGATRRGPDGDSPKPWDREQQHSEDNLQMLRKQNGELEAQVKRLQEQLDKEREAFKKKATEWENRARRYEADIKELMRSKAGDSKKEEPAREHDRLRFNLGTAQQEIDKLKSENKGLRKQLSEIPTLSKKTDELRRQLDEKEKKHDKALAEKEEEIRVAKEEAAKLKHLNTDLNNNKKRLEKDRREKEKKIEDLEGFRKDLEAHLRKVEQDAKENKEKTEKHATEKVQAAKKRHMREIDEAQQRDRAERAKLEGRLLEAKNQLKAIGWPRSEAAKKAAEDAEQLITLLSKELFRKEGTVQGLEDKVATLEGMLEECTDGRGECERAKADLEGKLRRLCQERVNREKLLNNARGEVERLKQELAQAKAELEAERGKSEELQQKGRYRALDSSSEEGWEDVPTDEEEGQSAITALQQAQTALQQAQIEAAEAKKAHAEALDAARAELGAVQDKLAEAEGQGGQLARFKEMIEELCQNLPEEDKVELDLKIGESRDPHIVVDAFRELTKVNRSKYEMLRNRNQTARGRIEELEVNQAGFDLVRQQLLRTFTRVAEWERIVGKRKTCDKPGSGVGGALGVGQQVTASSPISIPRSESSWSPSRASRVPPTEGSEPAPSFKGSQSRKRKRSPEV